CNKTCNKTCNKSVNLTASLYSEIEDYKEFTKIDISWIKRGGEKITIKIESNQSNFKVTKARIAFSRKSCDESKDGDFNIFATAIFDTIVPGIGSDKEATIKISNAAYFKCQRTINIYGKRLN
ncbi:MAG: hypothetical protein OQL16_13870, partial [Gammaproteobacteria bacterium]|nr:hypothetical protein [Gammaproteobacteria bacterium]